MSVCARVCTRGRGGLPVVLHSGVEVWFFKNTPAYVETGRSPVLNTYTAERSVYDRFGSSAVIVSCVAVCDHSGQRSDSQTQSQTRGTR